jgi:hypothetical protein
MASQRQIEANRHNGRLGGPKTEAGRQRSRLSSMKHGLTASTIVVLPEEDPKEYEEILQGFRESLQPEGSVEDALVLRLAQAHWRSLRARRIETGMLNTTASTHRNMARKLVETCPEHLDVHNAIGVGFLIMPPEQWQTYLRYDTTISRDFFKTLDALTKLQRVRRLAAPKPATEPTPERALTATAGAEVSESGIRSVSQNPTHAPEQQTLHELPSRAREQAVQQNNDTKSPRELTADSCWLTAPSAPPEPAKQPVSRKARDSAAGRSGRSVRDILDLP